MSFNVAISQRIDMIEGYNEVRDSLDREWYSVLQDLCPPETNVFPVPNVEELCVEFLRVIEPRMVVLTGGNDIFATDEGSLPVGFRNAVEGQLLSYAVEHKLPVFAVCRGFQFVNAYLKGEMHRVSGHVASCHELFSPSDRTGMPVCLVNSYHNFGVSTEELATDLLPVLLDCDGNVEAAIHDFLPWVGIMWHPERKCRDRLASDWLRDQISGILS